MKKILMFACAIALAGILGILPAATKDIAQLLPMQVLRVSTTNAIVTIEGNGQGGTGQGESWDSAMEDLIARASGTAFFGAVSHILLSQEAVELLPDILKDRRLRPAAKLYIIIGDADMNEATQYLTAHSGNYTMQMAMSGILEKAGLQIPILYYNERGFEISER